MTARKHINYQIGKRVQKSGRPFVYSVITDATLYNFKENRICIQDEYSWQLHSFFELELYNGQLIKDILFDVDATNDDSISDKTIEEFRWGHYVSSDFVNTVKCNLKIIGYDEEPDDIVILLLTYLHFIKTTYANMEEWEFGDLDLIDWMLNFTEENFPSTNLVIYPNSERTEFSKSASNLIHALLLEFSKTEEFKSYIAKRNSMKLEYFQVKMLVSSLQGKDKGNRADYLRRKIVRILYLSFRKCQAKKNEKLFVIGELISLVDNYKSDFDPAKYNDLVEFYFKRLRSLVNGLEKVQSAPN
jgi:hypothetical protein